MTEKERLVELLERVAIEKDCPQMDEVADYLLDNGVVVPPFRFGDSVYLLITKKSKGHNYSIFTYIHKSSVTNINFFRFIDEFGKTVFLTK